MEVKYKVVLYHCRVNQIDPEFLVHLTKEVHCWLTTKFPPIFIANAFDYVIRFIIAFDIEIHLPLFVLNLKLVVTKHKGLTFFLFMEKLRPCEVNYRRKGYLFDYSEQRFGLVDQNPKPGQM